MTADLKSRCLLLVLSCFACGAMPASAPAITAELARKCSALVVKQFPPREPGNPAAGSANGTGREQQDYFSKCVANNGNVDDKSSK